LNIFLPFPGFCGICGNISKILMMNTVLIWGPGYGTNMMALFDKTAGKVKPYKTRTSRDKNLHLSDSLYLGYFLKK
jgi:hypothetical protein